MKLVRKLLHIPEFRNQNCEHLLTEVILKGGFGNQLFQFATGVSIALEMKTDIYFHDLPPITNDATNFFGLRNIGIEPETIYKVSDSLGELVFEKKATKIDCAGIEFKEKDFSYIPINLEKKHNVLNGYFQSFKYFERFENTIRSYLKKFFKSDAFGTTDDFIIQIRLGDLLSNPEARKIHGIIPIEYLEKIVGIADGRNLATKVITDDAFNVKKVFQILDSRKEIPIVSESAMSDFSTMVNARNLAISNSTFGWWAGWIGDSQVYAPQNWFADNEKMNFNVNDFFPTGWLIL